MGFLGKCPVAGKGIKPDNIGKVRRVLQTILGAGVGGALGAGVLSSFKPPVSLAGGLLGAGLGGYVGSRTGVGPSHRQLLAADELRDHLSERNR